MNKTIAEQIEIVNEKYQPILMVRDFNVKIGKPYSRQQGKSIKRRKTAQKNN